VSSRRGSYSQPLWEESRCARNAQTRVSAGAHGEQPSVGAIRILHRRLCGQEFGQEQFRHVGTAISKHGRPQQLVGRTAVGGRIAESESMCFLSASLLICGGRPGRIGCERQPSGGCAGAACHPAGTIPAVRRDHHDRARSPYMSAYEHRPAQVHGLVVMHRPQVFSAAPQEGKTKTRSPAHRDAGWRSGSENGRIQTLHGRLAAAGCRVAQIPGAGAHQPNIGRWVIEAAEVLSSSIERPLLRARNFARQSYSGTTGSAGVQCQAYGARPAAFTLSGKGGSAA